MKTTVIQPHKSSLGMGANIVALITYLAMGILLWVPAIWYFAWIIPIIIFLVEKKSKFVKFHAIQALVIGLVQVILGLILVNLVSSSLPAQIVSIVFTVIIIFMAVMSYLYKQVGLPLITPIANSISDKVDK